MLYKLLRHIRIGPKWEQLWSYCGRNQNGAKLTAILENRTCEAGCK
jgi:hypothetical protein